jgi:LPS export ABC transporter protein LptC
MNVNNFFILLIVGLSVILFAFKPLDIDNKKQIDIPILELKNFKLIELGKVGLNNIMFGTDGIKYTDRYTIENVNFIDNTKEFSAKIKADNSLYKNNIVYLNGNVIYNREDGLTFLSEEAIYDEKTKIVKTNKRYISTLNGNRATGSSIVYNSILEKTKSKNVTINYKLKERK